MKIARPPYERTQSPKYGSHINGAINFDLVCSIKKTREAYYPDNNGIPTITFGFSKDYSEVWYFDHHDEALRDKTFDLLVKGPKK